MNIAVYVFAIFVTFLIAENSIDGIIMAGILAALFFGYEYVTSIKN